MPCVYHTFNLYFIFDRLLVLVSHETMYHHIFLMCPIWLHPFFNKFNWILESILTRHCGIDEIRTHNLYPLAQYEAKFRMPKKFDLEFNSATSFTTFTNLPILKNVTWLKPYSIHSKVNKLNFFYKVHEFSD